MCKLVTTAGVLVIIACAAVGFLGANTRAAVTQGEMDGLRLGAVNNKICADDNACTVPALPEVSCSGVTDGTVCNALKCSGINEKCYTHTGMNCCQASAPCCSSLSYVCEGGTCTAGAFQLVGSRVNCWNTDV